MLLESFALFLGWAAVVLMPLSIAAGFFFRRRVLTGILIACDVTVALFGFLCVVLAELAARQAVFEPPPLSFPDTSSVFTLAMSGCLYLTPLVGYFAARGSLPFDRWYRANVGSLWRQLLR